MKKLMPLAGLIVCLGLIIGTAIAFSARTQTSTPEAERILAEFQSADQALKTGQTPAYQAALDKATADFSKHTCGAETPPVNWTAKERKQVEAAQKTVLEHQQAAPGAAKAQEATFGGASQSAAFTCTQNAKAPADNKAVQTGKPLRVTQAVLALADLVLALGVLVWLKRRLQ